MIIQYTMFLDIVYFSLHVMYNALWIQLVVLAGAAHVKMLSGWNSRRHNMHFSSLRATLLCCTQDLVQFYPELFWVTLLQGVHWLLNTGFNSLSLRKIWQQQQYNNSNSTQTLKLISWRVASRNSILNPTENSYTFPLKYFWWPFKSPR